MKAINLYKEAYSGHPKEVWALSIITFVNRMGTMVLPFLTVYLTTVLKFSLTDAGLIASGFGFGSLAGSYLGGRYSDKIGANNVIIISLITGGIMFILMQFAVSFYGLMTMIFLTAMFGEAYRPAMTAAIGDYVPKTETGRSMSLIRLAINLGMAGGPAIGGFIAVTLGYHWLFWIDGLTCISAAIIFYFVSRHWEKQTKTIENIQSIQEEDEEAIPPLKNTNYVIFLIATYFVGFVFMQWFHSVPVFLKSDWNMNEDVIGILIGLSCIIIIIFEMPLIHSVEKAGKTKGYIPLGMFLIGVSYLLFLLDGSFGLAMIIISIWTCGEMIFMPLNNAIPINISTKKNRGAYMSYFWMIWSLIHITSPIFSLGFIEWFGYDALWFLFFGMTLISLALNYIYMKRIEKIQP